MTRSLIPPGLAILLLGALAGCNLPDATPPPAGRIPVPVTETAALAKDYFTAAVVVDTASEPVNRDQAQELVADANGIFIPLTGFGIRMSDFVEDAAGGTTTEMANRYIQSHLTALPNGIIIFSFGDRGDAKLYGGYGYSVAAPEGFHNTFVSPATGDGHIYIAVAHFSHKYAACGYGGQETVQSPVAVDGECRNQPGTACLEHNGYSMCENAIGNLYASTPTYFSATTIIHEFLHPFSPGGNQDHYATPECNAHMGYPAGFFDFQQSEYYNGLCPFVYDNFINSYRP
jgi:hypothetical protein